MLDDPANVNRHVRDYLKYYIGLAQAPRFAVLLAGPWGSGKTFHAKHIVSELSGPDEFILISLNGLSSQKEIDDALFAAV